MKKLMMKFAVIALLAACGPTEGIDDKAATENGGSMTIPEGHELHYEAFEITVDSTIEYSMGDGFGFCPKAGDLARFQLDVATGEGTAALFREGDESSDSCIEAGIDETTCMVEEEVTLTLDADELDAVVGAVAAIPTLICIPGYECDLCAVDQLTVEGETHYSNCCSDGNRDEWRTRMDAALAEMTSVAADAATE